MTLNVLVVDDSAVMRKMITKTLRLSGLPLGEIHEAPDGKQALELLRTVSVQLALVDINMPVMDGEAMVAQLRADPRTASLPVIIVSTDGSDVRQDRMRGLGCEVVHKPFAPETLRDAIIRVTGASRVQP